MPKTSPTMKQRVASWMLNAFAIAVTLTPVIILGTWAFHIAAQPTRQVVALPPIDNPATPYLFEEPLVTVTFDDGWESVYDQAAPIMSRYGIVSTQYILPSQFASPQYMSVDQVRSLKSAGHEIASHTYSHENLTTLSERDVVRELDTSVQVMQQFKLLDGEDVDFAPPNGASNDRVMQLVAPRFASSRNTMADLAKDVSSNDMNVKSNFNRYNLIGYTVGQYTTNEQFQAALDYAIAHKAWFIPIYHQVDESGERYSVTPATFEAHMHMIDQAHIKTATTRHVLSAYLGER